MGRKAGRRHESSVSYSFGLFGDKGIFVLFVKGFDIFGCVVFGEEGLSDRDLKMCTFDDRLIGGVHRIDSMFVKSVFL